MTGNFLNQDGQPSNQGFNARKVRARQQAELTGILKGVACDKVLSPSEAKFIYEWMNVHRLTDDGVTYTSLINELQCLFEKSHGTFEDPKMLSKLLRLINDLVNGGSTEPVAHDVTMNIGQSVPAEEVVFSDKVFCFTGKLNFGPRTRAHAATVAKGGIITVNVSAKLNYLVCGNLGSRDWSQSVYGEKIREAQMQQIKGAGLLIINEATWAKALKS
jgi:NAD-dependent DNA ligase